MQNTGNISEKFTMRVERELLWCLLLLQMSWSQQTPPGNQTSAAKNKKCASRARSHLHQHTSKMVSSADVVYSETDTDYAYDERADGVNSTYLIDGGRSLSRIVGSDDAGLGFINLQSPKSNTEQLNKSQYCCFYCGRPFLSSRDLKRHVLIHTGEQPFHCPYCPHRSNRKGNLKQHIMRSHPEKPFNET